MAFIINDRVKEVSNTIGTGSIILAGSVVGFQSFLSGVGNGNTTYYAIVNDSRWEVGQGTYNSTGNILSRDIIFTSSNSGNKISLSGPSFVYCTYPASKFFLEDPDGFLDLTSSLSGIVLPDEISVSRLNVSSGIVFGDSSILESIATFSGWVESSVLDSQSSLSGWSYYKDIEVSGWADGMSSYKDSLISGWVASSFSSNGDAVSGWADSTILNSDNAVSGWADGMSSYKDSLISGWADSTIINNNSSTSGWADGMSSYKDSLISGWAYGSDNSVSGWAKAYTDSAVIGGGSYTNWIISDPEGMESDVTQGVKIYVSGISGISTYYSPSTKTMTISPAPLSGWVDSTITNRDNNISGWASSTMIDRDNAVSGWSLNTMTTKDSAVSGWANATMTDKDNLVSGWADGMSSYKDSLISGWAAGSFGAGGGGGDGWNFNVSDGTTALDPITSGEPLYISGISGIGVNYNSSLNRFVIDDVATSGWSLGTMTIRDNAISGWADNTITIRDNAVSGWADGMAGYRDSLISGWADSTITNRDNAVSGWADGMAGYRDSLISGWADNTMVIRDNAVSGWALGTFSTGGTGGDGWNFKVSNGSTNLDTITSGESVYISGVSGVNVTYSINTNTFIVDGIGISGYASGTIQENLRSVYGVSGISITETANNEIYLSAGSLSGWAAGSFDAGGGGGDGWNFLVSDGVTNLDTITSGESLFVSGISGVSVNYNSTLNRFVVDDVATSGWSFGNDQAISGWALGTFDAGGSFSFDITDGKTALDTISNGQNIAWSGISGINVSYNINDNIFVVDPIGISGWAAGSFGAGGGGGDGWNFKTSDGSANLDTITSGEAIYISGISGVSVNYNSSLNRFVIDDVATSGWANSTITDRTNAVSGWANYKFEATSGAGGVIQSISGWADGMSSYKDSLISGWTDSTITNRDNVVSGWSLGTMIERDNAISGWADNTITIRDNAVSGWADGMAGYRDSLISGWADSTMTDRDNAVSGWALGTFDAGGGFSFDVTNGATNLDAITNGQSISWSGISGVNVSYSPDTNRFIVDAIGMSGWTDNTITVRDNAISGWSNFNFEAISGVGGTIQAVSGWSDGMAAYRDSLISGWTDSTITNRDNTVSGWADGMAGYRDSLISGWADSTMTNRDNAVSGWADGMAGYRDSLISGWADSTITNRDNAVSGWAFGTFSTGAGGGDGWNFSVSNGSTNLDTITSGEAVYISGISGVNVSYNISNNTFVVDAIGVSGWASGYTDAKTVAVYGVSGISVTDTGNNELYISAGALSGWANYKFEATSGAGGLISSVSGWADGMAGYRDSLISGWADSTITNRDNAVSGWSLGTMTILDNAVSGWSDGMSSYKDSLISGWALGNDQAISGWALGTFDAGGSFSFDVTDGKTNLDTISNGQNITWSGVSGINVTYNSSDNGFVIDPIGISGWAAGSFGAGGGGGDGWNFLTSNGSVNLDTITSGEAVYISGISGISVNYNSTLNRFVVDDVATSGWTSSTMTNRDNAVSGWADGMAGYRDSLISGWADNTMVIRDNAVSGWADGMAGYRDSLISGWADSTITNRDNAVSGWALGTFDAGGSFSFDITDGATNLDTISNGQNITWSGVSGINVTYNSDANRFVIDPIGISGWAAGSFGAGGGGGDGWNFKTSNGLVNLDTITSGESVYISGISGISVNYNSTLNRFVIDDVATSGWASSTMTNRDNAVSGWADGMAGYRDSLISGWADNTMVIRDNAVSGWADGMAGYRDSLISGWADSTMTNRDNAVSGWALGTFSTGAGGGDGWNFSVSNGATNLDVITSGQALYVSGISGVNVTYSSDINRFVVDPIGISGYLQSYTDSSTVAVTGVSGIVASLNVAEDRLFLSAAPISGWANYKFEATSGTGGLIPSVSGWADGMAGYRDSLISGWADNTMVIRDNAVSGWAAGSFGAGGGLTGSNGVDNRVATFTSATNLNGESNLTFDGTTLNVNGSLTAISKSFLIDHPSNPSKKLQYGSLEGPENGIYIRGRSTSMIIDLPEYWCDLIDENTITVHLTPRGFAQPNIYVQSVSCTQIILGFDNTFFQSAVDVYYTIYAERKDIPKMKVEFDV